MEVTGNFRTERVLPKEGRRLTGVVKRFDEKKGFGFILDSNSDEYFIHFKDIISPGFKSLARGQHVKFYGKEGPKGLFAQEVEVFQVGGGSDVYE